MTDYLLLNSSQGKPKTNLTTTNKLNNDKQIKLKYDRGKIGIKRQTLLGFSNNYSSRKIGGLKKCYKVNIFRRRTV